MKFPYRTDEVGISRNAMLCDGTPRREKGYRAYLKWEIEPPSMKFPCGRRGYQQSPLFASEGEAHAWAKAAEWPTGEVDA